MPVTAGDSQNKQEALGKLAQRAYDSTDAILGATLSSMLRKAMPAIRKYAERIDGAPELVETLYVDLMGEINARLLESGGATIMQHRHPIYRTLTPAQLRLEFAKIYNTTTWNDFIRTCNHALFVAETETCDALLIVMAPATNGNIVAIAIDRVAPPVPVVQDMLATTIDTAGTIRGVTTNGCWSPILNVAWQGLASVARAMPFSTREEAEQQVRELCNA